MNPIVWIYIQLRAFRNVELSEQSEIGGKPCQNDNRYVFYLVNSVAIRIVCLNDSLIKQKTIQKQQNALKNYGFVFIFCFSMNFKEHFLKTCISWFLQFLLTAKEQSMDFETLKIEKIWKKIFEILCSQFISKTQQFTPKEERKHGIQHIFINFLNFISYSTKQTLNQDIVEFISTANSNKSSKTCTNLYHFE